jgi:TRAP-type mannitol/chloroaromatic compound transport system substrate-binding protein
LSDKDITELAVAAPRARWKAVNAAALGDTSAGFGEQAQDFAAELLRTSAGKLEIELTETATVAQAIATPARIAADRQTFAWHTPTHAAGDRPERAILAGSVPFGLGPVEHVRWLRAEGTRLLEQSYADAGTPVRAIPCGIAGGVGGWFRREIRSPSDLKGLKIAAPELMSRALATLEATSVRANARSEIATAFGANRIDASLWYTPETDTFLGRARPATAYHFPGVHSPALVFDLLIGRPAWEAMPVAQRRLLDEACRRNLDRWAQAFPTTQNDVLDRIRAQRILVRPLTGPLRETLRKATDQIMDEESARNPIFRTVRESYEKFRRQ